ncbi:MAG: hypothetical protein WBD95_13235 [Xanthobacteraceae bacterium]
MTIAMNAHSSRRMRFLQPLLALSILTLLTNCIESTHPLLTDARPLLGDRLRFQLYALRQGAAHDPIVAAFVWRNDRYALTSGGGEGFGDITIHRFKGRDLIVQSIRPGLPAEYAIARKLADGTYLVVPIDETDADESTRKEFCSRESGASCRVATSTRNQS